MPRGRSYWSTAVLVLVFAAAMAYLEAAVVVYLSGALGSEVGTIFPLRPASEVGDLLAVEVGREAATLLIIAAIGALVGRSGLERLAWAAIVFGAWDIGYYAWLRVVSDWPTSLATTDLLFLIPVPWVGPVWSPVAVSVALIVFGLWAAHRLWDGGHLTVWRRHWVAGVGGGLLVVLSYTIGFAGVMDGGLPGDYPWPIFVAGMVLAVGAALDILLRR